MKNVIKINYLFSLCLLSFTATTSAAGLKDVPVYQKGGIRDLPFYVYITRKEGITPKAMDNEAELEKLRFCYLMVGDKEFSDLDSTDVLTETMKYFPSVIYINDVLMKKSLQDLTLADIKKLNFHQGEGSDPGDWRRTPIAIPLFHTREDLVKLFSDDRERRRALQLLKFDDSGKYIGNEKAIQQKDTQIFEKAFIFPRNNHHLVEPGADHKKIGTTIYNSVNAQMIEYLAELKKRAAENQNFVELAIWAYYEFEMIHPFGAGNGRTGRLIQMLIFAKGGYLPCYIHNKTELYSVLTKSYPEVCTYFCGELIRTHYEFMCEKVPRQDWIEKCWACWGSPTAGTKLQKCSKCNTANYCSKECQKANWGYHKVICQTFNAQKPTNASDAGDAKAGSTVISSVKLPSMQEPKKEDKKAKEKNKFKNQNPATS